MHPQDAISRMALVFGYKTTMVVVLLGYDIDYVYIVCV